MHPDDYQEFPFGIDSDDPRSAAVGVAVMIVTAAVFLAVLKKSGFRAMVAVGRG